MKIGFTTANFVKVLPLTVANVKTMIDVAAQQGWSFIELRDPEANLTLQECTELAFYAQQNCVEVVYALNVGPMAPHYFAVLARGIANTLVFDGPKMIRSGVNGTEFINNEKKYFWNAEEFANVVQNINQAANTATMFGLRLSVENAREGFHGDGVKNFGTSELFGAQGVNSNVGWQLDTANFFSVSRTANNPKEVKEFFEQQIEKIDYIHLKSSKDGQTQPILCENDLSLDIYLDALSQKGKTYVIIELPAAQTVEAVHENHSKSIAYLNRSY